MKKNPFFQYLSVIMGIIFLFFLVIPRIRAIASLDDALLFNVVV
jgi:hypothetical protein